MCHPWEWQSEVQVPSVNRVQGGLVLASSFSRGGSAFHPLSFREKNVACIGHLTLARTQDRQVQRQHGCCSAINRTYPDGRNIDFFPEISYLLQHESLVMKTQPRSQNSSLPHTNPNSTWRHISHSHPQESPHTLKHLKTGAETQEDGKISLQPFPAPAQLVPAPISLLYLLDITGCPCQR